MVEQAGPAKLFLQLFGSLVNHAWSLTTTGGFLGVLKTRAFRFFEPINAPTPWRTPLDLPMSLTIVAIGTHLSPAGPAATTLASPWTDFRTEHVVTASRPLRFSDSNNFNAVFGDNEVAEFLRPARDV